MNSRGRRLLWSEEDIAYLREKFPSGTSNDIAEHLGISDMAVRMKARELGLRKSEDFALRNYSYRYVRRKAV